MKNKGKIFLFLIIGIICIYFIITAILYYINMNRNTIYLGIGTKVYLKDNNIYISDKDIKIKKHNAKIYFNKEVIDGYVLTEEESSTGYDNNLHAYSKKGEYLSFYSSLIAFTKDLSINFVDIDDESVYSINPIKEYLVENDIDINNTELDYLTISSFDIDDDDKLEYIYSMGLIKNKSKYDNKVVMLKDDEYYSIYEESSEYTEDGDVIGLFSIMDMNNDGNYEYVLVASYNENGPDYYEIYNFDGEKFSKTGIYED